MDYNWNIEKLNRKLVELRKVAERAKVFDSSTFNNINFEIKSLNETLNDINNIKKVDENYIDKKKRLLKKDADDYSKIPDMIKNDIMKSFATFKDLNDTYEEINYSKFNISNEELIDLTRDFINWIPTKNKLWKDSFYRFTNYKNNNICFRKFNCYDFAGMTHFSYYPSYTPYFMINRKNTISDFITLIHELAHGTIGIFGNEKNPYIGEVEGWYFQFLGRSFLDEKNIVRKKQIKQLEYDDFSIVFDFYLSMAVYNSYFKIKNQKKGITPGRIKNDIVHNLNYFYLNEDFLKYYLSYNPLASCKYIYSYLLNLDLEDGFNVDPEFSFFNFERLSMYSTIINHTTLKENGFTCMDDGFKSLQKKIEKINTF